MTSPARTPRRRVVVTGMGAVTPLGNDVATFWSRLVAGESGVRTIESFDPERVTSKVAGEVRDFDPSNVLDRKEIRRNDRYTQFTLVAAREAMTHAGLPEMLEGELADRTGVIIGSGLGGSGTLVEQITINATRGPDRISPFFIPMAIANLGAGQAAISFGARGPNYATVSACATAGHAIGEASETIIRGDADVMLGGGSEAPIFEPLVGAFAAMRALSTRNDDPAGASRPFDEGRDGFVIAEGAAVLVLEELGHARARGARILAELCGYGATADANHITLPAPGGAGGVRAALRALEKAGIDPSEIDHVSAHATSTPEGDPAELAAFKTIFGDARRQGFDHRDQELDRPHPWCGRWYRRGSHDQRDARGLRATHPQPGRPIARCSRSRLHATDGPESRHPHRGGQRVRLRRPELGARLPALGRGLMSATTQATPQTDTSGLIDLIDTLETLLNESELSEIEVEAGGTTVLLRKPSAIAPFPASAAESAARRVGGTCPTGDRCCHHRMRSWRRSLACSTRRPRPARSRI